MSSNTSKTVAGAYREIATLRTEVREGFATILNLLSQGEEPTATKPAKAAKVTTKAAKTVTTAGKKGKKARKTVNRKAPVGGTVEGKRCLTSANRQQFIADHDWAQPHTSTKALAEAVLLGGQPLVGNWAIGPKRTVLVTGKAPVGKKGKAVVAGVAKTQPAKVTLSKAQQERLDAPRDAMGHLTPKAEWPIREALAATGKYDRFEIDAKTEAAMALLNS